MKISRNCLLCSKEFLTRTIDISRGFGKFCSISCSAKYQHNVSNLNLKVPNFTCTTCNKNFYRKKSAMKNSKSGLFFCSRSCKEFAQKLNGLNLKAIQPKHYGRVASDNIDHYRSLAFLNYEPKCNRCSYNEHIEILQVHHKDRNRKNDTISNLEILCPNCHELEHYTKS